MTDVDQDSPAWRSGVEKARVAIKQGLSDLEGQVARLEQDPHANEADLNFARYAVEKYREALS